MSLTASISPAGMALVGNPVRLSVDTDSPATYTIRSGDDTLFTGSGEGKFFVHIQDVLASVVRPAELHNESPDVLLPAPGFSREVSVRVTNTAGDSRDLTLKVYLGGVSKRMLRHLHEQNKSIFLLKLMNPEANFFLTTRTSGKLITLRETEIHPLSFIYPDGGVLKVVAGGVTTTLVGVAGQPYALNLYRLRAKLFAENHVLASVFDIMIGDTKSCTIVLTPGSISRERYLLEFLNSYGAYERIEVTGTGSIKRESDEDEKPFLSYDEIIDDYVESWERTSGRETMAVESGYRTPDELAHLIDMLSSDDVKILGIAGRNIRVSATAENLVRAARSTAPESIKLTLRFADSEQRYSASLTEENFGSPRIHTKHFSQQFN